MRLALDSDFAPRGNWSRIGRALQARSDPLALLGDEIERDMKLMGCTATGQLTRSNLRFR